MMNSSTAGQNIKTGASTNQNTAQYKTNTLDQYGGRNSGLNGIVNNSVIN